MATEMATEASRFVLPLEYVTVVKKARALGGPGSGNFGHAGRPGEVGGSSSGVTITEQGEGWVELKSTAGGIHARVVDGVFTVRESYVRGSEQGKGEGRRLYEQALRYASQQGMPAQSSERVSVSADRVWASLERRGFPVQRNANVEFDEPAGKFYAVKDLPTPAGPVRIPSGEPLWTMQAGVALPVAPRTLARHPETALHTAADSFLDKALVAVNFAFAAARRAVDKQALETAIAQPSRSARRRGILAAMRPAPEALGAALDRALRPTLERCYGAGGEAGLGILKRQIRTLEGHQEQLRALRKSSAFDMKFNAKSKASIAWAKKHTGELITNITKTTRRSIVRAVVKALDGGSPRQLYKDVLEAIGDPERANTIARHELMDAASSGQRESWAQAVEEGLLTGTEMREWISTEGACPICENLDGKLAKLDGDYPDEGGIGPPAHVKCLPGNSLVTPVGRVTASSERWYDGDLVVIRTASGHELSCTPNHPILTSRGWVGAGLLNVGDDVVSLRRCDGVVVADGDHQYMPASIEHIARFAKDSISSDGRVVPLTSKDLHGDGGGSNVAVIRTNCLLRDGFNAPLKKQVEQELFASIQSSDLLDGDRPVEQVNIRLANAASSVVSPVSLNPSLFNGHTLPPQSLALTLISWLHAHQQENSTDPVTSGVTSSSQLVFGFTGEVKSRDVLVGDRGTLLPAEEASIHHVSSLNSPDAKLPSNDDSCDPEARSEWLFVSPGEIQLDNLVAVSRRQFSGHVFTLQTESQLYIGNGIFTSNCRCTEGISARRSDSE